MNQLQQTYITEVMPKLQKDLGIQNVMAAPRLSKIVINMGVNDALTDKKSVERMSLVLGQITGQKPKVTTAKKSIASFKLREGDKIGLAVTLRGKRMYSFFHKLVAVILPRLRDFHGISRKSFDGHGNYSLGFSEYAVFPEIDPGKVERVQGLEVVIVTTARDNKEGIALLEALGMPFVKENK